MAHFAKLDENNIVLEVNVINNDDINNLPFPESEPIGIQFLNNWANQEIKWKQTSYSSSFRKNYACVGCLYDEEIDAFYPAKLFDSWVINKETVEWESPIPYPTDGKKYYWDEPTISWVEVNDEI